MIFVSGIHGVGKTYFCDMLKEKLRIETYSASQLIEKRKNTRFSRQKHVSDIDQNQVFLLEAIEELREAGYEFVLDGHFCLLNERGVITRISKETYISLKPDAMILLTEEPSVIADRRSLRDGVKQELSEISAFQEAEREYAVEIATELDIPLEISSGAADIDRIVDFVKAGGH